MELYPPPPDEADPGTAGGEEGGSPEPPARNPDHLRPSELAVLAREAGRYPMSTTERREMVEICLHTMRTAKPHRTRLSAVKTLAALDQINLKEEGKAKDPDNPGVQVNVIGTAQVNTLDRMDLDDLRQLLQLQERLASPAEHTQDGDSPPHNGEEPA
jgi:hypothetical protein